MNVLINATTLVKGGGIQVAASFIAETLRAADEITWHYALSEQVMTELKALGAIPERAEIFADPPTRSKAARRRLLDLETRTAADVVFTVFGPAYVRFRVPHVCGVAVCWVTHSTWLAYRALPGWLARAKALAMNVYKGLWLRPADRWVVEADNALRGLSRRIGIARDKIDVVPNSCAAIFREAAIAPARRPEPGEPVRLLYVTAYYPHKNLEIIPQVAAELAARGGTTTYEFVITVPESEPRLTAIMNEARALGIDSMIKNVGPVTLNEVVELYRDSHICFMPSLLETFSASYPEAMAMGRPIVASDLDFARAVCTDAAVYFRADSASAAADAVIRLLEDQALWDQCISRGRQVLETLPTARRKYELFVASIRKAALSR
ncbi:MAG: glycosyltransferase [Gammaproteobacteria bacterium]|jgi:glycosyltransferase involved in cell wall biosynthesis|nr:glycosyltransferase [Gammaproteobacteria bacterium]